MTKTTTKKKQKLGLTTIIFLALILGVLFGAALCYLVPDSSFKNDILIDGILYVIGQGFIRLMKMLVVPLVLCSLVCGSMAIGDTKKLGTVGVRTLLFYLVTTALAVTVAITIGNIINPGIGLDMSKIQTSGSTVETMQATSFSETLLNILPDNPFKALANGEMLQVIVFALIIGVILAKLGERAETVANFFSQFNDIMMEMTMMVMSLAPIGVFCLISRTFATIGFSAFLPLAKYMIAVLIALAVQCFGADQILLKIFTGLNPLKFIKKFFPVMAFAFSTATSNATIPLSIDTLNKKVGVSKKISPLHDPTWCNHQYGRNLHHAGRGSRICRTGIQYSTDPDRLPDRHRHRDSRLYRNSRRPERRTCHLDDGIQFCRSSGRGDRADHGYRPYP